MTQPITFTHEVRPPKVYDLDMTYFGADDLHLMGGQNLEVSLRLSDCDPTAVLILDAQSLDHSSITRTHLTAAHCCALAMALLDAAAYLRQTAGHPEHPQPEAETATAEGAAQ